MALVSELVTKVKADSSHFNKNMAAASSRASKFSSGIRKLGKLSATAFAGMATAAGLVVVSINKVAKEIDKLAKQARVLDIQVKSLQFLAFAADRSGVSYEMLTSTMERLAFRVNEAARGNKLYQASLKEVGLSAEELTKLPIDEQLFRVAKAVREIPNRSDQINIIRQLGGREAVKFLNVVNSDVEQLRKRFESFGIGISDQDAAKIEQYRDAVTDISFLFGGLGQKIAIEMAQPMTNFVDQIVRAVNEMGGFEKISKDVAWFLKDAFSSVASVAATMIELINSARRASLAARIQLLESQTQDQNSQETFFGFSMNNSATGIGGLGDVQVQLESARNQYNELSKSTSRLNNLVDSMTSPESSLPKLRDKSKEAAASIEKLGQSATKSQTGIDNMISGFIGQQSSAILNRAIGKDIEKQFGSKGSTKGFEGMLSELFNVVSGRRSEFGGKTFIEGQDLGTIQRRLSNLTSQAELLGPGAVAAASELKNVASTRVPELT